MANPKQEATTQTAATNPTIDGPDIVTMKDLLFIWKNNNYYNGVNKRKIFDVVLGTTWTIATIFLQMAIWNAEYDITYTYKQSWLLGIPYALFFLWIALIILSGIGKRKYLVMGLLFIPALGFLFFGTCLLTLSANAMVGSRLLKMGSSQGLLSMNTATIVVGLISLGILVYGISRSIKQGN